jgi:6-phosphogluconolactonase
VAKRPQAQAQASNILAFSLRKLCLKQKTVAIALPGGRSVAGVLEALAKRKVNWSKINIFMVDERLVPEGDPSSNFSLVKSALVTTLEARGLLPAQNVHPFTYSGSLKSDLFNYESELRLYSEGFDIALLSAGEDGHVASLFPNHQTVNSKKDYFITTLTSPKPPSGRVSASASLIAGAKVALVVFFGEEKRKALENFFNPKLSIRNCPAKLARKAKSCFVVTDLEGDWSGKVLPARRAKA